MSILSELKSLFKPEKETRKIETDIPVFRKETPEKILETRIRPIKVPTILDIGERLGIISTDLVDIKRDMVTKHWLRAEYDEGKEIIDKLETIDQKLDDLQNVVTHLIKTNQTRMERPKELTTQEKETQALSHAEKILGIVSQKEKINYSELRDLVNISDPTLSKHLKQLLEDNKIEKEKDGRFIYYSIPVSLTQSERVS